MTQVELAEIMGKAIEAAEAGDTAKALPLLEDAMRLHVNPTICSYLAYCTACERDELANAVMLCRQVMRDDPQNPLHYLNLGRIYQHHGRRSVALRAYRSGLYVGECDALHEALEKMGVRQRPPFPFLSRENLINKYLGLLRHRLQLSRPDPSEVIPVAEEY